MMVVILASLMYISGLFALSRCDRARLGVAPDDLFFVFLVPCLNEELVLEASLERLLTIPSDNFAILVVDDGSDDATPQIAGRYSSENVWTFRRELPDARRGKGEALNAAYRHLRGSGLLGSRRSEDVIVVIVDADGRLEPDALTHVAPLFARGDVGAVQVGVRMYNAAESLLTRMQDLEFVSFTEVFQRGRQSLSSVGLGGNGQFTRMAALECLGDAPWTDCLTEDLDLGIRLALAGWTNRFCPGTHVSQQAVNTPRRLIRQRARWFQGHLQCWSLVPSVLASRRIPRRAATDLTYHLLSPVLILLTVVPIFVGCSSMVAAAVGSASMPFVHMTWQFAIWWYGIAFAPAWFYGYVYWRRTPRVTFVRAVLYGHAFTLYGYLWLPAGWMALSRIVRRRGAWAKTTRTADETPPRVLDLTRLEHEVTVSDDGHVDDGATDQIFEPSGADVSPPTLHWLFWDCGTCVKELVKWVSREREGATS
jgi:cellulose synthase/poly-beta-1,6-N-acetylglucosamine synthase-like glycosyltransferase